MNVRAGEAVFVKDQVTYSNGDWHWLELPNNQTREIVVRLDRKKQNARLVHVPKGGWRRWLYRLYNRLFKRFEEIPLAIATCQNWVVTEVTDVREWAVPIDEAQP